MILLSGPAEKETLFSLRYERCQLPNEKVTVF